MSKAFASYTRVRSAVEQHTGLPCRYYKSVQFLVNKEKEQKYWTLEAAPANLPGRAYYKPSAFFMVSNKGNTGSTNAKVAREKLGRLHVKFRPKKFHTNRLKRI